VWDRREDALDVLRVRLRESHPFLIARELNRAWDLAWELIIFPLGSKSDADLATLSKEHF
jgi:hypothetical protein